MTGTAVYKGDVVITHGTPSLFSVYRVSPRWHFAGGGKGASTHFIGFNSWVHPLVQRADGTFGMHKRCQATRRRGSAFEYDTGTWVPWDSAEEMLAALGYTLDPIQVAVREEIEAEKRGRK